MAATPGGRTFFFPFCVRFLFLCSTAVGFGGGGCYRREAFPGSGGVQQSGDESPRGEPAAFPFPFCECRRFGRTVGKTLVCRVHEQFFNWPPPSVAVVAKVTPNQLNEMPL